MITNNVIKPAGGVSATPCTWLVVKKKNGLKYVDKCTVGRYFYRDKLLPVCFKHFLKIRRDFSSDRDAALNYFRELQNQYFNPSNRLVLSNAPNLNAPARVDTALVINYLKNRTRRAFFLPSIENGVPVFQNVAEQNSFGRKIVRSLDSFVNGTLAVFAYLHGLLAMSNRELAALVRNDLDRKRLLTITWALASDIFFGGDDEDNYDDDQTDSDSDREDGDADDDDTVDDARRPNRLEQRNLRQEVKSAFRNDPIGGRVDEEANGFFDSFQANALERHTFEYYNKNRPATNTLNKYEQLKGYVPFLQRSAFFLTDSENDNYVWHVNIRPERRVLPLHDKLSAEKIVAAMQNDSYFRAVPENAREFYTSNASFDDSDDDSEAAAPTTSAAATADNSKKSLLANERDWLEFFVPQVSLHLYYVYPPDQRFPVPDYNGDDANEDEDDDNANSLLKFSQKTSIARSSTQMKGILSQPWIDGARADVPNASVLNMLHSPTERQNFVSLNALLNRLLTDLGRDSVLNRMLEREPSDIIRDENYFRLVQELGYTAVQMYGLDLTKISVRLFQIMVYKEQGTQFTQLDRQESLMRCLGDLTNQKFPEHAIVLNSAQFLNEIGLEAAGAGDAEPPPVQPRVRLTFSRFDRRFPNLAYVGTAISPRGVRVLRYYGRRKFSPNISLHGVRTIVRDRRRLGRVRPVLQTVANQMPAMRAANMLTNRQDENFFDTAEQRRNYRNRLVRQTQKLVR
jgi:hypothetical protein